MFIPDEKIEEIRAATDIVDVVGDYVRLKKRGSKFWGLCPFHTEKTPSFSVDPDQNLFYCFGCQRGGDVYTFVREIEGVGFFEAVRTLAERAGIPLPLEEVQAEEANEVEAILNALRFAARFFFTRLVQAPAGRPALAYLRERGFTPGTIRRFGLGYAPDQWDGLLRAAEAAQIRPEMLEKAGLVIRRDGDDPDGARARYYDRFRGRVIFPILSHVGKVLGFGGRILAPAAQGTGREEQPKYINSPETKVYNKSRVLYGLYQGKRAIRSREEAILVEGYTDVIALHQAGVENVVAASGTALTTEQVRMLGRYCKRILLLYDADAAGAGATLRAIDLVLEQGLSVYAVALPPGEDPDSFVRAHGGEAFEAYVAEHRKDFVAFLFEQARRRGALDTPEGVAEAQRAVVAAVARIPDPLVRESYLRRAAEVLGVPDMQLRRVLEAIREETHRSRREPRRAVPPSPPAAPGRDAPPSTPAPSETPDAILPQEKILHRLMLEHGIPLVEFILGHMAEDEFTEGPSREMVRCLLEMYETGEIRPRKLLDGSMGEALQRLAAAVLVDPYEPSENWLRRQNIPVPRLNEDPYESAASAMTLLKRIRVDAAIARKKEELFQAQQRGEEVRTLQQQMIALHELRKQIERRAFLNREAG
ncbi:DNA primase [Rhodocaloribacter litoris]|uniref:DNA primase n=1 Tax=Rhodocaloribacter litoris TaxID=2558931 RepID=UPI00141DB23F|nr:DNA primase [Rhodocaloribacter litoris]QXD15025.1 DNA primase [Rhodocaloribacter litoris]